MIKSFAGKKLLILGGAFQHSKLVEAAREMGVITYVTDFLPVEKAYAKQIADYYLMLNITEIDKIVAFCKTEKIDGVIAMSLDACQKPYQQICERLGLPCFGTKEQFHILTDKNEFKKACAKFGVDTIPEYDEREFEDAYCEERVPFPVLVKPAVSRGSRGQTICHCREEVLRAIAVARSESDSGEVVIEKYMGQNNDFSMTILLLNGEAHLIRTVDRLLGTYEDGLDKLAVGSRSPSVHTECYINNVHCRVADFLRGIGLVNAPVFMQGFVDGETIRFYDPGLRLPGGEYERMFRKIWGVDPLYPLIEFALTGHVSDDSFLVEGEAAKLKGKYAVQALPALRPGKICTIEGLDKIKEHPNVVSLFEKFLVSDVVEASHNVNQRFCEIDLVCDGWEELAQIVEWIFDVLKVTDENGKNMVIYQKNFRSFLFAENA